MAKDSSQRQRRSPTWFWWAWLGMAYFNALSSVEDPLALKAGLAIVPPLVVMIYVLRQRSKKPS